jgi:hypothetical protein
MQGWGIGTAHRVLLHKGAEDRLITSESLSGRMSAVLRVSSSRWVVQVEARAARQVGPGKPEPVSRVGRGALGRSWASESVRVAGRSRLIQLSLYKLS